MQKNWFEPDHRIAVIFGMSKFDAVYKRGKQGFVQAFDDLETVSDDCDEFQEVLSKYGIKSKHLYNLDKNPTSRDVETAMKQIGKKLREGKHKVPMERYLVMFLFAGHGLQRDGLQVMLYNEFDPKTRFHKQLRAELKLRTWAEIYPNSYIVCMFASCR